MEKDSNGIYCVTLICIFKINQSNTNILSKAMVIKSVGGLIKKCTIYILCKKDAKAGGRKETCKSKLSVSVG